MARHDALPAGLPPRGLCRVQAAQYVGVSPSTFDAMVKDGLMPRPKLVGTRKIWIRPALDAAQDELPDETEAHPWDGAT